MSKTILTVAHLAHRWGVSTNLIYKRLERMASVLPERRIRYMLLIRYHGPAAVVHPSGVHPPQMPVWHRDAQVPPHLVRD